MHLKSVRSWQVARRYYVEALRRLRHIPHGANVQLLVVISLSLSHLLYRKGKKVELIHSQGKHGLVLTLILNPAPPRQSLRDSILVIERGHKRCIKVKY